MQSQIIISEISHCRVMPCHTYITGIGKYHSKHYLVALQFDMTGISYCFSHLRKTIFKLNATK